MLCPHCEIDGECLVRRHPVAGFNGRERVANSSPLYGFIL